MLKRQPTVVVMKPPRPLETTPEPSAFPTANMSSLKILSEAHKKKPVDLFKSSSANLFPTKQAEPSN